MWNVSYFLKPDTSKNKIEVEVDLLSYATNTDLKNPRGFDKKQIAKKDDLSNLKWDIYKLDLDQLKTVSVDLKK